MLARVWGMAKDFGPSFLISPVKIVAFLTDDVGHNGLAVTKQRSALWNILLFIAQRR